ERVGGKKPAARAPKVVPAVSSLFTTTELHQDPRPLIIGERTNTNGSRKFKQLLEKDDWHGLVEMGQEQEREGAHVIDVCTAYVGRDEIRDMTEVLRNGLETLEGIRRIKQGLPGALTTVGLSNVSFGLSPYARQVVNSVFLHYGVEYGLDSAILHAAKILPLDRIDETGRELARRLLFAEHDQGDPLQQLIGHYADKKAESKASTSLGETIEERLKQAIIQGRRE